MSKGKLNPSNETAQVHLVPEQPPVENKYPGLATRAYRTAPIVVETPTDVKSEEDAPEGSAE